MNPYILSPSAAADLESIAEYYSDKSPAFAERLTLQLVEKFNVVARSPRVGSPADHLLPGMRKTSVRDYIVYFRPAANGTEFVRVIHGSRDVSAEDFAEA